MKSILFVCEEFREDGTDRGSTVFQMLRFLLGDEVLGLPSGASQRVRRDFAPEEIAEIVQSGAFVVLCNLDGPKIQAARTSLSLEQPRYFMLPFSELRAAHERGIETAMVEEVAIKFLEYLQDKPANGPSAAQETVSEALKGMGAPSV